MTDLFTPRAAVDEDLYRGRIPEALAAIDTQGNLLQCAPDRADRLALMQVLATQELITWNRALARYQLTAAGQERLAHPQSNPQERRRA
jgi:hypothetical protein